MAPRLRPRTQRLSPWAGSVRGRESDQRRPASGVGLWRTKPRASGRSRGASERSDRRSLVVIDLEDPGEESHPEQIQHGVHGFLVPLGRSAGVADAMRRLAKDPNELARMGQAARRRVVEEFGRDRMMDRYEAFFQEVVAAFPRRFRDGEELG